MPTLRHWEVARHRLTVVAQEGPQAPNAIRERWRATGGPGEGSEAAVYDSVVRMIVHPRRYAVPDDEGRLVLSPDGEKVAAGGDFILGR